MRVHHARVSTPPQHPPAPPPAGCLNCGVPLGAPPPHYCPACGQDTRLRAPTLREFAQQFTGQYLSTEGALWRTLALLFLQPGELTRRYIAGRRRHYVLPVRLYLTISLLALLALRLGSGMAIDWQADKAAPGAHAAATAASADTCDAGMLPAMTLRTSFRNKVKPSWPSDITDAGRCEVTIATSTRSCRLTHRMTSSSAGKPAHKAASNP